MTQKRTLSPLAIILILSGIFFALFLVISGAMFLSKSSFTGRGTLSTSSSFFSGESVGVIELNGPISESKKTLTRLERFEDDDDIKAVVLRLNSPGGSVAPSQEIYEAVKAYKKPLVVSMGSVAASGAYYIACGAKKVFANPGSMTGSIGVIMEFANLQKLYDWAKVRRYSIKTGKYKDVGAEYREMTPEDRKLLQDMVDDILTQFKKAVSTGRNIPLEKVSAIADGRIFTGSQAKAARLVDELGTLKDAIHEAAKLGKIKGKPHVVYVEKPKRNILDLLSLDDSNGNESSSSLSWVHSLEQVLSHLGHLKDGAQEPSSSFVPGVYWLWKGPQISE